MKRYQILISILFVVLLGCTSSKEISSDKVDAVLLKQIATYKENDSKEIINFSGICTSEITDTLKNEIKECGINIHTITKNLFTGSGDYLSIIKLSNLAFIKWLEAPTTLNPTKSNN